MKNSVKLLALALLAGGLWSCSNNNTQQTTAMPSGEALLKTEHRGKEKINLSKLASLERFSAASLNLDASTLETIRISGERAQQSEDAALVVSIFNNLLAAESEASALDLSFSMSDEPIADGVFLFTINTDAKQSLAFEMYDEEGFELSANNRIQLTEGTNYKAINVAGLENGHYVFKLKNEEGQSLVKKVVIQQ